MREEDRQLAEECRSVANQVDAAQGWVERNAESVVRNNTDSLLATLRASKRELVKAERAASRKMCVAIFGPSQAGKSYLVSALARDSQGTLGTTFQGTQCDFLRDINPEGGKESTGLVTRFTITPYSAPEGYPVRIRLLSEIDVIKIIINTYYSDIKHQEAPDAEAVCAILDTLATKITPGSTSGVTLDDMEELAEYVTEHFKNNVKFPIMKNAFWPRAIKMAPQLSNQDLLTLLSVIWDNTEEFSLLYKTLRDALHQLGGADEAYCPLTALLPRKTSIIDVSSLSGITASANDMLELRTIPGNKAFLSRSVVTALAAELTIVMATLPHPLFEYTDLLDFPGYRSRFSVENFEKSLVSQENKISLDDYFLRGKVAYLFERYRDERELTSMILCIGPSTQEVQALPRVIDDWVASAHGGSSDTRKGKAVSLFLVLSKFDLEFQQKGGSGSTAEELQERWRTRLKASLLDYLGQQFTWPQNWDGSPFNNIFCIRNPNVEADFFAHEDGKETVIRAEKSEYIEKLRKAFIATEEVIQHFEDPQKAWDAVMTPNDGGVGYLKEKLSPLCNPDIKRQQVKAQLHEEAARIYNTLQVYYKSGDYEAEVAKKVELAKKLTKTLGPVIDQMRFGELLRRMQLEVHECFDLYLQLSSQSFEEKDAAISGGVFGERTLGSEVFDELFGDEEAPQVEEAQASLANASKNEAQYFSLLVEKQWVATLRSLVEDQEICQYFSLSEKEFGEFVHEVIQGAARLRVRQQMEEAILGISQYRNVNREKLAWKQASLAAEIVSAYISWLGFSPKNVPETNRVVELGARQRQIFADKPAIQGLPVLSEVQSDYAKVYCVDWLAAFYSLMRSNVSFATDTFNSEENAKLGSILQALQAEV